MSNVWQYGLDLPIKAGVEIDVGMLTKRLGFAFYDAAPMDVEPTFGPSFVYEGRSFVGIEGISVEGGRLRIGGWGSNLGAPHAPRITPRFDVMLEVVSSMTDPAPGDIVGCVDIEYDMNDEDHAHPIIACEDGICRLARTTWRDRIKADPKIVVTDRLPLEAFSVWDGQCRLDEVVLADLLRAGAAPSVA